MCRSQRVCVWRGPRPLAATGHFLGAGPQATREPRRLPAFVQGPGFLSAQSSPSFISALCDRGVSLRFFSVSFPSKWLRVRVG